MTRASLSPLANLWDEAHAATLDEPGQLLYRSNLLGSDLRITNFGGGNTSAQVEAADPLTGVRVKVLWVKGSGGDLGSIKRDGFATLYLDKLESLKGLYRGLAHEDENRVGVGLGDQRNRLAIRQRRARPERHASRQNASRGERSSTLVAHGHAPFARFRVFIA